MSDPKYINPCGYTLNPTGCWEYGMGYFFGLSAMIGIRRKRRQYEFRLKRKALTLDMGDGRFVQPDRHGFTDLGSSPELLETAMPRNAYEPSFICHDSGYRERGLYVATSAEGPFEFKVFTRQEVDDVLYAGMLAEGAWHVTAWTVYRLLRTFGKRWPDLNGPGPGDAIAEPPRLAFAGG